MKLKFTALLLVFSVFMATGCADRSTGPGGKEMRLLNPRMSVAEQEEQSYFIFEEILALSDRETRQENLPQIRKLYRDIIKKYPDSGLAQESYLRLILIAREEKTAAGDMEAERLYQEFLGKYPNSNLKNVLEYEARTAR